MKGINIFVCSLIFCKNLVSYAVANNCTEEHLKTLSFLNDSGITDRLFQTVTLFTTVGKKYATNTSATQDVLLRYLKQLLNQYDYEEVPDQCLRCFAVSIHCGVKNCKSACMKDQCSKGCKKCHESKCEADLKKCIGEGYTLLDPCNEKNKFAAYKLPDTPKEPSS